MGSEHPLVLLTGAGVDSDGWLILELPGAADLEEALIFVHCSLGGASDRLSLIPQVSQLYVERSPMEP